MGGNFSKSKSTPKPKGTVTEIDRAVLDLKVSRDRLTRYKKKLNLDSQKLLHKAKSLKLNNDTKSALALLKIRKMKEKEVDQIDSQLITIQTMVSNIQTKEQEAEVLQALRSGKSALEKLHSENTLEDVLKLMEEVDEQNEMEREINDVLMSSGEGLTNVEEDELEAELMALVGGKVEEGGDLQMPAVPTDKLPEIEKPVAERQKPARVAVPS